MRKIYIEDTNHYGAYIIGNDKDDRTLLIQSDWDYPGIASSFGWIPYEECRNTDGTVDCKHHTASGMIASAAEYLDGYPDAVEDPGYFDEEE
jgi:hypothetical protein